MDAEELTEGLEARTLGVAATAAEANLEAGTAAATAAVASAATCSRLAA